MAGTNFSRRKFTAAASLGLITPYAPQAFARQDAAAAPSDKNGPREADFQRDYDAPSFKPSWKKAQVNRTMAQDFVIYAHSDLPMVKKLLTREPGLLNATLDWGGGDWETALGGASHMGRRDIVEYLLEQGGRPDIFCFTMLGMLEPVRSMLELQPALIDAKGPHGFSLHFHAQVGQEKSKKVLDYLQSVKEVELRPVPFLRKKKN
ncbi:MAG: hypothetical protein ACPIA2_05885 [Mariniblastus sp.]